MDRKHENTQLTPEQLTKLLAEAISRMNNADDIETDNNGQLVVYTGVYRWSNGTYNMDAETHNRTKKVGV